MIRSPPTSTAARTMNAPGRVTSAESTLLSAPPTYPPMSSSPCRNGLAGFTMSSSPSAAAKATAAPSRVSCHPPAAVEARSTYTPAARSTNGSSQRPLPKNGANESRHHFVNVPSPGRARAISVIAPRASRNTPTSERVTSGLIFQPGPSDGSDSAPDRRRERVDGARRVPLDRRRVAIG